VVLTF
jgi:hypothetical protein